MTEIARRIMVQGRVQGVGYRYWAISLARQWAIRGWVRNRRDGTVEILCIGPVTAVETFTEQCSEGPASARVIDVAIFPASDDGSLGFDSRPTM